MKKYLFLPACVPLMACHAFAIGSLGEEQLDAQKAFLSDAIVSTPYSAVVKHTDVEVINMPDGESVSKHVYYADVIETIRGEERRNIRYTMFVERGEDAILDNSPVIITLCVDNGDYYWPGVGAQFHVNNSFVQLAKSSALRADTHQSYFPHCDSN